VGFSSLLRLLKEKRSTREARFKFQVSILDTL
jgi:hypothetical protein